MRGIYDDEFRRRFLLLAQIRESHVALLFALDAKRQNRNKKTTKQKQQNGEIEIEVTIKQNDKWEGRTKRQEKMG